jgi:hypothetical protein
MGWSFRRRIKVIPGVYLNVSKRGVSTSVGVRGASLTFQKNGVYSNVSIPGTGLYKRQKLGGQSSSSNLPSKSTSGSSPVVQFPAGRGQEPEFEFISADPLKVTSPGLEGLQEAIIEANNQRESLQKDLCSIQLSIRNSHVSIFLSKVFLVYFLFGNLRLRLQSDLKAKRRAAKDIERSIRDSSVPLAVDLDPISQDNFRQLSQSFKELATSQYIWDLTSASSINKAKERSAASMQVDRKLTKLSVGNIPGITCPWSGLCFANVNGGDLYLYPGFFILYNSPSRLGVLDMRELKIDFSRANYVESSVIPVDSIQISQAWEKSNKDGSQDRRYSVNRLIPVMEYGEITFSSRLGISEKYLISNYEKSQRFYHDLAKFINEAM